MPTILIADDEAPIRAIMARRLESVGANVLIAVDGQEALELALAESPDLIISDLQMPRMTGIEFALSLRGSPGASQPPFILLTARGHILEPGQEERARITKIMSKPFSAREVVDTAFAVLASAQGTEKAA